MGITALALRIVCYIAYSANQFTFQQEALDCDKGSLRWLSNAVVGWIRKSFQWSNGQPQEPEGRNVTSNSCILRLKNGGRAVNILSEWVKACLKTEYVFSEVVGINNVAKKKKYLTGIYRRKASFLKLMALEPTEGILRRYLFNLTFSCSIVAIRCPDGSLMRSFIL